MKRVALLVALVACNDTTQNAPTQLNLDRPVDIAFACYGGLRLTEGGAGAADQKVIIGAQPVQSCVIESGAQVNGKKPMPPGQEDITGATNVPSTSWYAFILQSGPGTVALARFETKPSTSFGGGDVQVLDADPLTPGKNSISVGENPIAIATDKIGCFEVIANQGSCDISELAVNSVFEAEPVVNRLEVKNASGIPMRARPSAMAFEPGGGIIGKNWGTADAPNSCPAQATGLAYMAYPNCHLVAGVDVSTGTIVTGIQFDAMGVPSVVDGNVTCPAECDGAPTTTGVRPVALDLELDPRTGRALLAIGSDNSNVLTVFELDNQTFLPLSALPAVPLLDTTTTGRLGITSIAISPLIGIGGGDGFRGTIEDEGTTGGDHQFVYSVTTDGTVRVVDLTGGAPRECDTQVDPRYLHEGRPVSELACMGVGAATTPPRRANAKGPGIELIADAIPTSVDVFLIGEGVEYVGDVDPKVMIGYFGVITAMNGQTYIFNIDDDHQIDFISDAPGIRLGAPPPLVIPHQLRDAVPSRGMVAEEGGVLRCDDPGPDPDAQSGAAGGPRSATAPVRTVPSGVIAQEKLGNLPLIRQVTCPGPDHLPVSELFFSAPVEVRTSVFPDLRGLRGDETWTLTWEGSLSLDKADTAIDGPSVRSSQIFVDGFGMHLVDQTRPFCDAGVENWDIVQLRGCDPSLGDAGCPAGYTCYVHPQSQVAGLGACIQSNEAERLQNACAPFLKSLRRFTVATTKSGDLRLLPRKYVLRTTPLSGCVDDAQCQALADYAIKNNSPTDPVDDMTPADTHTWTCQADPDRAPLGGTGNRCIMSCETDTDCAGGTVCQPNPSSPRGGFCMEGVIPPQACVNAAQRYELRAGQAFALVGGRTGYLHSIVLDPATDACVKDPNANPYLVSRVPLTAAPCDPTADPLTGLKPDLTFEPNPCQLTVDQTEYQLNYQPNSCSLATPSTTIITRPATAIRIRTRGMNLTLVDPTYPGDARCNGDRGGSFGDVPLVPPGFQLGFRQVAGFLPFTLGIQPSFPIKVVRGPTQSIWVIDEGDYLSTSITTPSTRGKVFRIESRAMNVVNLLE